MLSLKGNLFSKILFSKKTPYKITSILKNEGCQKVYKALQGAPPFQQEVILKLFPKQDQGAFEAEWESLIQTSSLSCCANLLNAEQFKKNNALILESVKGITLWELARETSLSKEEVNHLIQQIYKGLKELKGLNLFHGDLSLSNVLVNEKGEIKFIDFGKGNRKSRGTAPFAAPEILKGGGLGWTADLFSLGVIAFFLENSHQLQSLKNKPSSHFISLSPLLHEDPEKRSFPKEKYMKIKPSKLHRKAQTILHFKETHWRTEDMPQQKQKMTFALKPVALSLFCVFMSFFIRTSSSKSFKKESRLKIHTKEWFYVTLNTFKGYTPLEVPLSSGRYQLLWKSHKQQGEKTLYIPPGKTLVLNDRDFL